MTAKPSKEICEWIAVALIMSSLFNTRNVLCLMMVYYKVEHFWIYIYMKVNTSKKNNKGLEVYAPNISLPIVISVGIELVGEDS